MLDFPFVVDFTLSLISGFISLYLILTVSAVLFVTYHAYSLTNTPTDDTMHRIGVLVYSNNSQEAGFLHELNTNQTSLREMYESESTTALKLFAVITGIHFLIAGTETFTTLSTNSIYVTAALILGAGIVFGAARIAYYKYKHYRSDKELVLTLAKHFTDGLP